MILLSNATANATGTGKPMKCPVTIFATGGFGGGTATIQVAPDVDGVAGTYVDTDVTFTAAAAKNLFIFGSYWIRAVLAGATASTLTVRTS